MEVHTSRIFAQTLARVEARLEGRERTAEESIDPPGVDVRVRLPRKPEVSIGLCPAANGAWPAWP